MNFIAVALSQLPTQAIGFNEVTLMLEEEHCILDREEMLQLTEERGLHLYGLKELKLVCPGRMMRIELMIRALSVFKEAAVRQDCLQVDIDEEALWELIEVDNSKTTALSLRLNNNELENKHLILPAVLKGLRKSLRSLEL